MATLFSREFKNSKFFKKLTSVVIIITAVLLGIESEFDKTNNVPAFFLFIDIVVILFFAFELFIRYKFKDFLFRDCITTYQKLIASYKKKELHEDTVPTKAIEEHLWLYLDTFIFITSLIALGGSIFQHPEFIFLFRLLRIFRVFRLFEVSNVLKSIEKKILYSIPTVTTFGVLLFIILYVYAIIGMHLFEYNTYDSGDFSNTYKSINTLFMICTNGWNDVIASIKTQTPHINSVWVDIYFVSFFIFSVMITLNVFIAVLTSQIQEKVIKNTNELVKIEEKEKEILAQLLVKIDKLEKDITTIKDYKK